MCLFLKVRQKPRKLERILLYATFQSIPLLPSGIGQKAQHLKMIFHIKRENMSYAHLLILLTESRYRAPSPNNITRTVCLRILISRANDSRLT